MEPMTRELVRFCRKVFPAHNFLRFQDHVKTRSSGSVTPIQRCRRTIRMSPAHGVTASAEASPTSVPATAAEVPFRPAISIFNLNGLVHCVCADPAPTCQVAGRRRTKPSGREARAQLGDHDPPTPMDKAERSARVLSEQTRGRDQFHLGLWPLSFPPCGFPNTPQP